MQNFESILRGNFSIRKFKTGVASVLLSTSMLALSHQVATASAQEVVDDTVNTQVLQGIGGQSEGDIDTALSGEVVNDQINSDQSSNTSSEESTNGMTQGQSGCELDNQTCSTERSKIEVSNDVDMDTKIIFNEKSYDHVNKVKNEDNPAHDHTNPDYAKFYGPGDLEFNYWNSNKYANTYTEHYRVNFGTEHEILDGILSITLPYTDVPLKDLYEQGLLKLSNASEWLVTRLYRNESLYDRIIDTVPEVSFDKNTLLFKLGNLDPRTALSIQVERIFANEAQYDELIAKKGTEASAHASGKYNFTNIDLPTPVEKTSWENYEGDLASIGFDAETVQVGDQLDFVENVTRSGFDGTKNGYISQKKTTYRIVAITEKVDQNGKPVLDEEGNKIYCYNIERTVEFLKDFTLQAESVIDTTLKDYSNNGYLEKVFNDNNHGHAKVDQNNDGIPDNIGLYGPGNVEVQHWQDGPNEATQKQFWRFVFANDYSVANGKLTLTLPYEISKESIQDVSHWLTSRYYPAVEGAVYSNVNSLLKINLLDRITVEGKVVTLDLSDLVLPSRTAFALQIAKVFESPQDFSNNLQKAQMKFEGQWYFNNIDLPHEEDIVKNSCPECKIELPEKPKPEVPTPEVPETEDPEVEQPTPEVPETEDPEVEQPTPEVPETEVPELEQPAPEAPESVEQPQAVQEAGVLPATGEAKQNLVWFGASATILAGLGLLNYQTDKKKTR